MVEGGVAMIIDLIKYVIKQSQIIEVLEKDEVMLRPHTLKLVQTGTSPYGAGKQTSIMMLLFEDSEQKNNETYDKIRSVVGEHRTVIKDVTLYRLRWSSDQPEIALDNTWGRHIDLTVIHMEDE
jgi:hypothetical protein